MGNVTSGLLIVKTYERLYHEFGEPWDGPDWFYGIPRVGIRAGGAPKEYRGIDREPLWAYGDRYWEEYGEVFGSRPEPAAQQLLYELEVAGKSDGRIVFELSDAEAVMSRLVATIDYELVWAGDATREDGAASDWSVLGYDATWFTGDAFSAIADVMFFPRWHGPDADGTAFREFFDELNVNGLFDSADRAGEYLRYYLSFDWTETGEYVIAEIRSRGDDV